MAATGVRFSLVVVVCLLCALTGCGTVSIPRQMPLDAAHRGMAMDAVNRLSEPLNRGACPAIYDDASEPFQQLEPVAEWRSDCARMRKSLGSLQSFEIRAAFATGPATVLVDGTAKFAKGPCHFGMTWVLEGGHARLFSFYLQGPAGPMMVPPARPRVTPRREDPPPIPQAVAV